jgi:wyosine [tRNA(Phe)-imidazoG37] synthetase (radical SAM superfamily)
MMLLGLKEGVVYGPVHSRRLGRSLGVNILPSTIKVCTFDCLYCQYGWTGAHGARPGEGVAFPAAGAVIEAVKNALVLIDTPPAYITLSGNGEPTLHPDFPRIVDGIIETRDRFSPASRTAILSNSTEADTEAVRGALSRLDARIMKLDSGTEQVMRRFNQPCEGVRFDRIVEGLARLGDVTIQALFTGGEAGNADVGTVGSWVECVERIAPGLVQIYTLDRDYPSRRIAPLSKAELLGIGARLDARGIRACVF